MTKDFLLEIGTEELPHKDIQTATKNLVAVFENKLKATHLNYKGIKGLNSPRRLSVWVTGLEENQKDQLIEKWGPPIQASFSSDKETQLTAAGEGFIKSVGLFDKVYQANHLKKINKNDLPLYDKTTSNKKAGNKKPKLYKAIKSGKEFLFYQTELKGKKTLLLLPEISESVIRQLTFKKSMRWSDIDFSFLRPIKWLLCLFGNKTVPIDLSFVKASSMSYGHRQMSKNKIIRISSPQTYLSSLKKAHVLADPEERLKSIENQLSKIEKKSAAKVMYREKISALVCDLVEKPHLIVCEFASEFLKIPNEIIISEMVEHQMYFPLQDLKGNLKNQFIVTSNTPENKNIRLGNIKVLTSRLKDGQFLYNEDLKIGLTAMGTQLKQILYEKNLGSYGEKVVRITKIAEWICHSINNTSADKITPEKVLTVCQLMKNDLASLSVGEFPHLQGIMGSYFSKEENRSSDISLGIQEHYLPEHASGPLPKSMVGAIVSMADRIDTLLGCVSVGLRPTENTNPYTLKQHCNAVIRILIEKKIPLDLGQLLNSLTDYYPFIIKTKSFSSENNHQEFKHFISEFLKTRLKTYFKENQFSPDEIDAALTGEIGDLNDLYSALKALKKIRKEKVFAELTTAIKRIKNILKNKKITLEENLLESIQFEEEHEQKLYRYYVEVKGDIENAIREKNYHKAFVTFASFAPFLDNFFKHVLVNVEDQELKEKRHRLLGSIDELIGNVLDFDKLIV